MKKNTFASLTAIAVVGAITACGGPASPPAAAPTIAINGAVSSCTYLTGIVFDIQPPTPPTPVGGVPPPPPPPLFNNVKLCDTKNKCGAAGTTTCPTYGSKTPTPVAVSIDLSGAGGLVWDDAETPGTPHTGVLITNMQSVATECNCGPGGLHGTFGPAPAGFHPY